MSNTGNKDTQRSAITSNPDSWSSPKPVGEYIKFGESDLHPERIERLGQFLSDTTKNDLSNPDVTGNAFPGTWTADMSYTPFAAPRKSNDYTISAPGEGVAGVGGFTSYPGVELEKQIERQGGRLLQLKSNNPSKPFEELSDKYQIKKIYVTGEFTKEFKEQIDNLNDTFDVHVHYDNLVNPKTHLNQTGNPYKVFTQFANQWKKKNTIYNLSNINKFNFAKLPEKNADIPIPLYTLNQLGEFLPGEEYASKIFSNFIDKKIHFYKNNKINIYRFRK